MRCGKCLQEYKSHLRLKKHMADEHGVLNEFTYMSIKEYQKNWRESKLAPYDIARDTTSEKRNYF